MGLLTMAALSSKLKMSRDRARLINISGIVGTLYGLGTGILLDIDVSEPDFWGVMGIGGILGLAAGAFFTRGYDAEEGYFAAGMELSTIALSHADGGQAPSPGAKILVPLVGVKF